MAETFRAYRDMELSDDAKLDIAIDTLPAVPDYPPGLKFTIREAEFAKLGIDPSPGARPEPGDRVPFVLQAVVTSARQGIEACRIEIEIEGLGFGAATPVALGEPAPEEDGVFAPKPCLCLGEEQCERLDLDEGCEVDDRIVLCGTARVEGWDDTRWGGKCLELQIVEMAVEGDQ